MRSRNRQTIPLQSEAWPLSFAFSPLGIPLLNHHQHVHVSVSMSITLTSSVCIGYTLCLSLSFCTVSFCVSKWLYLSDCLSLSLSHRLWLSFTIPILSVSMSMSAFVSFFFTCVSICIYLSDCLSHFYRTVYVCLSQSIPIYPNPLLIHDILFT